ncbi:MAG TPA: RNA polymerase sigma factor [Vicinamibacterales bacterium]|nr:RNA polymerase sigma factor [Vicinamibacterales bacterium]
MADVPAAHDNDLRLHLTVLRCQAGDERAFRSLLDEFGGRTLRYLRGLVEDDADDVQQEVWLSVYRSIASLANPGAFRTWLFSTTRRRAIDHLRSRRRERELMVDSTDATGEFDLPIDDPSIEDIDRGALGNVLAGLPPPQREVLLLRFQDELSYAEIALVVGCPVGTVKTRIHHAKRKLQELLRSES